MPYLSHAHLKTTATPRRMKELVRDLEFYGCTVHVHYGAKRIDFEVAEHMERWIVLGGLASLLSRYEDILCWHPNFSHHDEAQDCDGLRNDSRRKVNPRAPHHL
jgi:hypothetical protein